ncbi:MAG: sarcosine oxidase subunit gamma family protein, partial [Pseudomonadota bacterium]
MMVHALTDPQVRSPLAHREQISAGHPLTLRELPTRAMVCLRGCADQLTAPVREVTGLELPRQVRGTVTDGAGKMIVWLSPDEWMLIGAPGSEAA